MPRPIIAAERLLHGAPCPVAVAPGGLGEGWSPRRVGAGFLDADDARGALRAAGALARAAGADLRAVTAIEPVVWGRSAAIEPYAGDGTLANARRSAERALDRALAALPPGPAMHREIRIDRAADVLARLSRDVDLLVCGSRAYGPVRAVLAGSVVHALLRAAACPVLVVPRGRDNVLTEALEGAGAAAR